jgi:tetratricopeptide (TPR) repeat protein
MSSDAGGSGPWSVDPETLLQLRLEKARALLRQGEPHLALVESEELLEGHPHDADATLLAARSALDLGDAVMAAMGFEEVLRMRPDAVEALELLAAARFYCADLPGALAAARRATELDDTRVAAWHFQGMVLERQGDPGAAAAFARAEQLAPADYPYPARTPAERFGPALELALRELDPLSRRFYARVPLRWQEWPDADELRRFQPPVNPLVDALYQGEMEASEDPWAHLPDAVVLYQGNLSRPPCPVEELAQRIGRALRQECHDWLGRADGEE